MDIGVVGRLLSCSELCRPGEEHRGWSCDHISLDGDRDTGDWEGSGKHLIGWIDISLLFLTWIQDGCRMGAGFDQDLWVELSEHFFLAPFFSVLVLMSWHWACTHLWTLWLCDLMWVSAVLVSQCLHGGQWPGCREQKEIRLEGLCDFRERWMLVTASVIISLGWRVPFVLTHFLQVETHSSSVPHQGRAWPLETLALNYNP